MNERLKELAEQAGIFKDFAVSGLWLADDAELTRFAELIRLDETKACAEHYLEIMRDAVEQAVTELRRLREVNQELLEVLQNLCKAADNGHVASYSNLWDDAKAAIAKAEVTK